MLRPDVVLMDPRMARLDGAAATARIVAEVPGTRVLVLTTYGTDADIVRELFIGESTVKTHLLTVFAKLGVDDAPEPLRWRWNVGCCRRRCRSVVTGRSCGGRG